MKKYLDIDESNIVSRTRAYFRLHGKDIPVLQDGDRSIVHVEKSVRWAFRFIFNLNKKKSQSPQDQQDNNTIPIAPQDHDEYIPQDMQDEDREDPNKPPSFWQISPPLEWYHYSGRKSYYDIGSKLWSKKKILSDYHRVMDWSIDTTRSRHTFTGNIRPGTYSIPLPIGSIIDTSTLESSDSQLHLREDQNGCIYVEQWVLYCYPVDLEVIEISSCWDWIWSEMLNEHFFPRARSTYHHLEALVYLFREDENTPSFERQYYSHQYRDIFSYWLLWITIHIYTI